MTPAAAHKAARLLRDPLFTAESRSPSIEVWLGLNGAEGIDRARGAFTGGGRSVTRTLLARHHSIAEIMPVAIGNQEHADEGIQSFARRRCRGGDQHHRPGRRGAGLRSRANLHLAGVGEAPYGLRTASLSERLLEPSVAKEPLLVTRLANSCFDADQLETLVAALAAALMTLDSDEET